MKVKLDFIPFPANIEVLPEETIFLVIDLEDYEGAPEEIDIRFIAELPDAEIVLL